MNSDRPLLIIGLYLNSVLYLAGVFYAGIIGYNGFAWKGAIATAGVCFLAYLAQISGAPRIVSFLLVAASIVLGAAAGLSLLVLA